MLRTGSSQSEIIQEVMRRHVPEKIDGITEDKFISSGANRALIAALKSDENILTPKQKTVFDQYQNERAQLAEQAAEARRNETEAQIEFQHEEQQRRRHLQIQTAHNVAQSQNREVAYEVAQRNYEARRKSLEVQIQSLQNDINRRRSHGWREADLAADNQYLDELNKELRDLTPPLR